LCLPLIDPFEPSLPVARAGIVAAVRAVTTLSTSDAVTRPRNKATDARAATSSDHGC